MEKCSIKDMGWEGGKKIEFGDNDISLIKVKEGVLGSEYAMV